MSRSSWKRWRYLMPGTAKCAMNNNNLIIYVLFFFCSTASAVVIPAILVPLFIGIFILILILCVVRQVINSRTIPDPKIARDVDVMKMNGVSELYRSNKLKSKTILYKRSKQIYERLQTDIKNIWVCSKIMNLCLNLCVCS